MIDAFVTDAQDYARIDDWYPDPDVSCALPDFVPVVLTLIGAVVMVCAVGIAVVNRIKAR